MNIQKLKRDILYSLLTDGVSMSQKLMTYFCNGISFAEANVYELASGEPLSLSTTIADNYIIGNGGLNSEICMDIGDVDGITIDIYQMLDSCNMPMKAEIGITENCGIFYQRDRLLMLVGGNTHASLAFRSDCQTGTIGKMVIRYSGNYIIYVSFEGNQKAS